MITRERLHRLVDELPEHEVHTAERFLQFLRGPSQETDPVLRAFLEAPEDDGPLTPEEVAAIEEGKAEAARGELLDWETAKAELRGRT